MDYPVRKKQRLADYSYTSHNYYFVTICTKNRVHLFGLPGKLSCWGKVAERELLAVESHFSTVKIEKYVVMPNHVHAIISIGCNSKLPDANCPTLSSVVGLYKSGVSRIIHEKVPELAVWQKSFFDHVIRNRHDYQGIWTYIDENPAKWEQDDYY